MTNAFTRLQAMKEFVDEVDKNYLRPLQKEAFLGSAQCCDTAATQEDLQSWYAMHWGQGMACNYYVHSLCALNICRCHAAVIDAKHQPQLLRTMSTKSCKIFR